MVRLEAASIGRWSARDEGSCVRAAALLRTGLMQLNQGLGLGGGGAGDQVARGEG
jgi:hypothetical protein